jgi:ATP adenylyltransferase
MKVLWAPWRMNYIREGKSKGCFFCHKLSEGKDEQNLILYQGKHGFVIMNKYPYNNGHLMIVPKRHCLDFEQLNDLEIVELFTLLKASLHVLRTTLSPHGFNIGVNIGKSGGAGEEHLHLHIVPRWTGDTNFMPVFNEAKVIPEYLGETYRRLRSAFKPISKRHQGKRGGQIR